MASEAQRLPGVGRLPILTSVSDTLTASSSVGVSMPAAKYTMTSSVSMRTRDEVYRDILHFGLLHIRNAGYSGDARSCEIEADHLHDLPSLIGEENELRHQYYYDQERTLYLERMAVQDSTGAERARFTLERYCDLWAELEVYRLKNQCDP